MKVYQYRGKNPLKEIMHIQQLLGSLWRGYHAYDPEHTDQDGSVILYILNNDEQKQSDQMLRDGNIPTLYRQRYEEIERILMADGYEVHH